MSFPKIKMGTSARKRSMFDLSHTNTTTAEWGFLQPIFGLEMTKDCRVDININDFIRLAPMNAPTFAKGVKYHKFGVFVPYEDVYKPFANLLTQKPYKATGGTYIPQRVPYVTVSDLTKTLLANYSFKYAWKTKSLIENVKVPDDDSTAVRQSLQTLMGEFHDGGEWYIKNAADADLNSCDFYSDHLISTGIVRTIGYRLTDLGKRIRKVLLGLGYQLGINDNSVVSLMPIFCYYKAYFDTFYPQRNITWTSTKTYGLLNNIIQNNVSRPFNNQNYIQDCSAFLEEIGNAFYTYPVDYYSAQLGVNSLENTTTQIESINGSLADGNENDPVLASNNDQLSSSPYGSDPTNSPEITAIQIWMVEKLTKYVNKNSVIGGKIYELLAAHGLGKYVDDHRTNFIGTSTSNIQVFDVDCTNMDESSGAILGNYTGKGVGSGHSEFTYTSSCFGHLIIMSAIVPEVGYCQGIDGRNRHTSRFEYYHSEFDALGMVAMRRGDMFTYPDTIVPYSPHMAFGLVPRYSEYKQKQNILNGDMSLQSSQDSMLTYTLDRFIRTKDTYIKNDDGSYTLDIDSRSVFPSLDTFINNSINWRFCNRYPWMANFNRIFFNSGTFLNVNQRAEDDFTRDNFIIHSYLDVKLYAPYISLSSSYMTDADQESTIEVNKE